MGFLPSPDIDLTSFSQEELNGLRKMLEVELGRSKARQVHIQALMKNVDKHLEK